MQELPWLQIRSAVKYVGHCALLLDGPPGEPSKSTPQPTVSYAQACRQKHHVLLLQAKYDIQAVIIGACWGLDSSRMLRRMLTMSRFLCLAELHEWNTKRGQHASTALQHAHTVKFHAFLIL